MKKEYLIVGQGIAGSLLAYELLNRGVRVKVINQHDERSASQVAAGIYNPITGRKMVKTWNADKVFPILEGYYGELEKVLKTKFLYKTGIYRPFFSVAEQNDWQGNVSEEKYQPYVGDLKISSIGNSSIIDQYGGLQLQKSGYVATKKLLNAFKSYFTENDLYQEDCVEIADLQLKNGKVIWKEYSYDKVIFCEGPNAAKNPYFNWLPFRLVKGEILDIDIPYHEKFILNRGVFMLPEADGQTVRLGATYDNHRLDCEPTLEAVDYLKEKLSNIYNGSLQVRKHVAGVRPATKDRKPFIGTHPSCTEMCIFNGFGTKGVSLAVYYARQFAEFLVTNRPIDKEVNIERFLSFYLNK